MKKLEEIVTDTKAGFGFEEDGTPEEGKSATLIKRNDTYAIYLRDDGYYEVGKIKKQNERTTVIAGVERLFKAQENYWVDEDFGMIAKTTKNKERALAYYKQMISGVNFADLAFG